MEKQWNEHLKEIEGKNLQGSRLLCFLVGYDNKKEPHFYYFDNQTSPPFLSQKREISDENNCKDNKDNQN